MTDLVVVRVPLDSILTDRVVNIGRKQIVVGRMDIPSFTLRVEQLGAQEGTVTRPATLIDCETLIERIYLNTTVAIADGFIELWCTNESSVNFDPADAAGPPQDLIALPIARGTNNSTINPYDLVKGNGTTLQLNTISAIAVNAADLAQGFGWRLNVALANVVNEARARLHADTTQFQMPSPASILGGFTPITVAEKFGLCAMETDVELRVTQGDPADQLSFAMAPAWIFGTAGNGLAGSRGYGIVWGTLTGPNYRLFACEQVAGIFVSIDTGVSPLDGVKRLLRLEWGYDPAIASPVMRAVIDGVTVAQITSIAFTNFQQIEAMNSGFPHLIAQQYIADAGNEIVADCGFAGGCKFTRVTG
jgi:hypothetical protein